MVMNSISVELLIDHWGRTEKVWTSIIVVLKDFYIETAIQ